MPRAWSDLYWLALGLAAAVLLMVVAKNLFQHPTRRERRWLAIAAGLALVAAGCAERPLPPPAQAPTAGWADTFAQNLQTT